MPGAPASGAGARGSRRKMRPVEDGEREGCRLEKARCGELGSVRVGRHNKEALGISKAARASCSRGVSSAEPVLPDVCGNRRSASAACVSLSGADKSHP